MTRPRPKRDTNTAYNSIGRAAKDSTDVWATPKHVLKWARERFGDFSLDAAASEWNSAAPEWIDEEADGLKTPWITDGVVWCNPPYGKRAKSPKAYTALGTLLRTEFANWRAGVIVTSERALEALGRPVKTLIEFQNGGIKLRYAVLGPK